MEQLENSRFKDRIHETGRTLLSGCSGRGLGGGGVCIIIIYRTATNIISGSSCSSRNSQLSGREVVE